jgi:hypothetical protein
MTRVIQDHPIIAQKKRKTKRPSKYQKPCRGMGAEFLSRWRGKVGGASAFQSTSKGFTSETISDLAATRVIMGE